MDAILSCCCGGCVLCQSANEVGEKATYTGCSIAELTVAPTMQDIKTEMGASAAAAGNGQ